MSSILGIELGKKPGGGSDRIEQLDHGPEILLGLGAFHLLLVAAVFEQPFALLLG